MSKPATTSGSAHAGVLERLGRYDLIHRLGAGGMAEVFLARQRGPMGFEKLVVVKKIHETLARQPSFIEMLLKEARVSALLKHPNIVDIYDLGHAGKTYFIAMEYLAGQPLTKVITHGVRNKRYLSVPDAVKIAAEAAAALDAAHNLKSMTGQPIELIHRDVSPGNIVVLYDGSVKLVDFGIAKIHGEVTQAGGPRMIKGKTGYLSPEQIETGHVDRRCDVFSLGIVLWESLTLRRLFRTDDEMETLEMIKAGDVSPPSRFRPEVPKEVDLICLKALSRDADERYQTAAQMRTALENFLWTVDYGKGSTPLLDYMTALFADTAAESQRLVSEALDPGGRASTDDDDLAEVAIEEDAGSADATSSEPEENAPLPLPAPQASGPMRALSEPEIEISEEEPTGVDERADVEAPVSAPADDDTPIVGPIEYERRRRRRRLIAVVVVLAAAAAVAVLATRGGDDAQREPVVAAGPADAGTSRTATESAAPPAPSPFDAAPIDAGAADAETADAAPGDADTGDAGAEVAGDESDDRETTQHRSRPSKRDRARAARLYKDGFRSFVRGDTSSAQKSFRAAIAADSRYAPAYRGLGLALERAGRTSAAKSYFAKYLRMAPQAADAPSIRARMKKL